MMCSTTSRVTPIGISITCSPYICPKLSALKSPPKPVELIASLALIAIHCESKFCWITYPVKAVPTLIEKITTPTIHVFALPSRQPAPQNCPQRCSTMKMKNIWTDQKWVLLKKWPTDDTCHQADPKKASTTPLITSQNSAAMVTTPKMYTHEPIYAGCLVGSSSVMGSVFSTRRRTEAVQPVSSSTTGGAVVAAGSTVCGAPASLITGLLRPMRRERRDQSKHEQQHHHADEDEVRQRDENEAPVNVWSRRVHWQPPCYVGMSSGSVCVRNYSGEGEDVSGIR